MVYRYDLTNRGVVPTRQILFGLYIVKYTRIKNLHCDY